MALSAKLTVTCDRCLVEEEFPMLWSGCAWNVPMMTIKSAREDGWRWAEDDEHVCPECVYEEECCNMCDEHHHNCVCYLCGDCGEDDCICHLCEDCGYDEHDCICEEE